MSPTLPDLSRIPKKQILIGAGVLILLVVVFMAVALNRRPSGGDLPKVQLEIWGVDDDPSDFEILLKSYKTVRPNVDIVYKKIGEKVYETTLLNALASEEGPDIYTIRNSALARAKSKLAPVNPQQISLVKLRELFPTVVEQDFVDSGQILALPLWIDTLALFYNRDLFDQAAIVSPPASWQEFEAFVPRLRVISGTGRIERAGAAVGGSKKTISAAVDLLSLLMIQNGTPMADKAQGKVTLVSGGEKRGLQAFNFYLQFVNAASPAYTWNDSQPNSLDSFIAGKTAMILDYGENIKEVKRRAPFLKFGVAAMPQPEGGELEVNNSRYAGFAVSRQSKNGGWAWDFIVYAATNPNAIKPYLLSTGRAPALRSLVAEKLDDPDFGVFARQALTARSWYKADDLKIEEILNNAILGVLSGQFGSRRALEQAEAEIELLMRPAR